LDPSQGQASQILLHAVDHDALQCLLTFYSARPCNIHPSIHPLSLSRSIRPHSSSTSIRPHSSSTSIHPLSSPTLKSQPRQQTANMISHILLILITIFLPPVGVFMIAGCGADLLINICLTCLGYAVLFFTQLTASFTLIQVLTMV
jgi:uncharacterized membrane protein YqaE (UPF0057 family)